jgi:chromosome segregation ATPase
VAAGDWNRAGLKVALVRLDQADRALDRLEEDLDQLDKKLDEIVARIDGQGNRVTSLEQWRTDFERSTGAIVESKRWLVGAILAGAAVVISVVGILVAHG